MYDLIHRRFPDAIYQYHSGWLGHQSLDVYVPSIATAFEYQGIQHYKAIEFFGGEIGLKKRLFLDKNKMDLCNRNGITLVEWKYDEPVTTISLDKKLTHCSQSPIDH